MKYRICKTTFNKDQCKFNSYHKWMPPMPIEHVFCFAVANPNTINDIFSGNLLLEETDDTNHMFITHKILNIKELILFFKKNFSVIQNINTTYPAQVAIANAIKKHINY